MVKTIVYTKNPNFVPTSIEQVADFAWKEDKYYTMLVNEDSPLYDLEKGAHIVSTKGNNLYVLEAIEGQAPVKGKSSNITGIAKIEYPFGEKVRRAPARTSIKNFGDRIKSMFMPTEADGVRISINGEICVEGKDGYVAIDAENNLVTYPAEMTIGEIPAYIVSKPASQLQVGDIVARDKSYIKVTRIQNGKITGISYSGTGAILHTMKDFLLGQSLVRVVVNLFAGQQFNPGMMAMMSMAKGGGSFADALPFMMMANQGNQNNQGMLALALMGNGEFDFKNLMLMNAFSGGQNPFANVFGGMFGQPAAAPVAAPVAAAAPVVAPKAAEVVDEDNAPAAE